MDALSEKLSYTITSQEFRQRQGSRIMQIFSFVAMGTILLAGMGYALDGLIGGLIGVVILPSIILYLLWYERRKYRHNLDITMDDWGIHLVRGAKREEYAWSEFSKGMTLTDFNRSTTNYTAVIAQGDQATRATFGEAFVLIYKKQPWFKMGTGLRFLAEPDNHQQVRAFLEKHVKWGVYGD